MNPTTTASSAGLEHPAAIKRQLIAAGVSTAFSRPAGVSPLGFDLLIASLDSYERHRPGATATNTATNTPPRVLKAQLLAAGLMPATDDDLAGLPPLLRRYVAACLASYTRHRPPLADEKAAEARLDEAHLRLVAELPAVAKRLHDAAPRHRVRMLREEARDLGWPPSRKLAHEWGTHFMPPDSLARRVLIDMGLIPPPRPRLPRR